MKEVITACDFPSAEDTLRFLEKLGDRRPFVKIGMELYYAEGPDMVRRLKDRGHRVFLDLKLHDIPHTVERAMTVLARLGADLVNVHAGGSIAMMEAALQGLSAAGPQRPQLIAVTMLTSTDEATMNRDLRIPGALEETVAAYARNAKTAGLDGVVCSPHEAGRVHELCGAEFLTVTPGIRFAESERGDQKRVTTPAMAAGLGSDYIVVGRPITASPDPAAAYDRCVRCFATGKEY